MPLRSLKTFLAVILVFLIACKSSDTKTGYATGADTKTGAAKSEPKAADTKAADTKVTETKAVDKTKSPAADISSASAALAADLIPLEARSYKIAFCEGPRKGTNVDVVVEKGENGQWKETVKDVRILHYADDNGAVVMSKEEDLSEKVTITYDPPFVLMPKTLEVGKPFEATTKMTVLNRPGGSTKASGTCKYKVELLEKKKVQTAAGEVEAWVIRTTRDISLDLASVQVMILTSHAPKQGMVASRVEQKTQALGIFGSESTEEWSRGR